MRKFLSQLLLIAALCVPWVTQGQSVNYSCTFENDDDAAGWTFQNLTGTTNAWTIGTATANGGTKSLYISNDGGTTNAYTISQTADAFAYRDFTLAAGTYDFSFDWKAYGESTYDFIRVYLLPMSQALAGGRLQNCQNGWICLDGGGILNLSSSWTTRSGSVEVPTAGTYSLVFFWRNDGSGGSSPAAAIDNIIFAAQTCPALTALTLSAVTTTTADFTFTAGGSETSWQYLYGLTGFTPDWSNASTVSTNAISLSGLTQNTQYDLKVRAYCSADDQSVPASLTFKTACGDLTIPYTEGFENAATGSSSSTASFIDCWTRVNDATSTSYQGYPYVYNYNSRTGSKCLSFYQGNGSSYPENQIAVLPQLNTSVNAAYTLRLKLWAKKSNSSYDGTLKVGVMTDPTDATTFVQVGDPIALTTTYAEYVIPLSDYAGTGAYVAVKCDRAAAGSYQSIYVDDVTLEEIPACMEPSELSFSAVTNTAATLAWSNGGDENYWNIQYKAAGDNDWTDYVTNYPVAGYTWANSNPYTITGLQPNTIYYVRIRAYCNDDHQSSWTNEASFHTECNPISNITYTQNFENFSDESYCWTLGSNYSSPSSYVYLTSPGINGDYALRLRSYKYGTSSDYYSWAALPRVDDMLNLSALSLRFNAKSYSTVDCSTYTSKVTVGVMTDPSDTTTFTAIRTFEIPTASTVMEYEVSLAAYEGMGKYVALLSRPCVVPAGGSSYTSYYNYIDIDDVQLVNSPICPRVTNLAVDASSITATSAKITWTPGDPTIHNYTVGLYDPDHMTINITVGDDFEYTLTGLTPNTDYRVQITTLCSGEPNVVIGQWTPAVSFSTLLQPVVVDADNSFEDTFESGSSWAFHGNNLNNWTFGTAATEDGHSLYVTDRNSGRYHYTGDATGTIYAVKLFNISQGTYNFEYDVKVAGGNDCHADFLLIPESLGYDAAYYAAGVKELYRDNSWLVGRPNWFNYRKEVTVTTAGNYYVVLSWNNEEDSTHNPPVALDNFSISYNSCPTPINVAASNLQPDGATITWTPVGTGQTGYAIAWGTGTDPDDMEMEVSETNSFVITGLDGSTDYHVFVQAYYDDCESEWSEVCDFRTLIDCGEGYRHIYETIGEGTYTSNYAMAYANTTNRKGFTAAIYSKTEMEQWNLYDRNYVRRIYLHTTADGTIPGFKVYMQNVENSTFATGDNISNYIGANGTATEVYSGELNTFNGWTEILLPTPFGYNSDDNLMVILYREDADLLTSAVSAYYTSTSNTVLYGGVAEINGNLPAGSRSSYRPNMTFEMCSEIPSCTPPHDVVANNVTATSAQIDFVTDDDNHDNFTLAYGTVNNPDDPNMTTGLMTSLIVNDYLTLTNLTPQTTYYVFVRSECGSNGQSSWAPVCSFTTPCLTETTFPITENFDATTFVPSCWSQAQIAGTNAWARNTSTRHGTSGGSAYIPDKSAGTETALTTMPIAFNASDNYLVSFWMYRPSNSYQSKVDEAMHVYVTSQPNTIAGATELGVINNHYLNAPAEAAAGWYEYSFNIPQGTSGTNYIMFVYHNQYGAGAYIDDITVDIAPSCQAPSGVTVTGLTTNSISLEWTPADASNTNFTVAYGTTSTIADMATLNVVGNTATITGLTENSTYYYAVKAVCSPTEESEWSAVRSTFLGYCQPAPTSVDNSGITNVAFGNLTNNLRPTSSPYYGNYSNLVGTVYEGSNVDVAITYATSYTYGTIIWVDWNRNMLFDASEVMYVGTSTSANPTVLSASFGIPEGVAAGNYRMRIAGADSYYDSYVGSIAAAANANSCPTGTYTVVHDYTLQVATPPTCPLPTDVVVDAATLTPNSATVSWTSDNDNFVVKYGTVNDLDEMTSSVNAATTSATLTGLLPNTTYYVAVQAVCSANESSPWSSVVSFRTACVALTAADLPYTEDFESYSSGTSSSISYCWTKGTNSTIAYPYPYSTAAINGSIGLYFYSYTPSSASTEPTYCYAALPELASDLAANTLTLRFNAKRYAYTSDSYHSTIQVGVMTDPELISTFVPVQTIDMTNLSVSTVRAYEVDLADYTGTGKYIAFYAPNPDPGTSTYAYNYIYVDDVELVATPTCFRPTSVSVAATTATTATIGWTPDSRCSSNVFEFAYGPDDLQFDDLATTNVANATSYTLSSLAPNTNYKVYMRTLCGTVVSSDWTAVPVTFRTLNDATEITAFAITTPGVQKSQVVIDNTDHTIHMEAYMGYDLETLQFSYSLSTGAAAYIGADQITSNVADFTAPLTITVKAEDRNVTQDWTILVSVEDCGTPRNLTITNVTRTSMDISWTDPDPNVTSYAFYLGTTPYDPTSSTTVQVNATTYHAADLLRGTTYYVHVASICGTGVYDAVEGQQATHALSECVENAVADGAATNTYAPLYGLYCDDPQRCQSIYPASMLAELQGKTITGMKYFVSAGGAVGEYGQWDGEVFTVKLAVTDQANLASGWATDAMTTVYTGTLTADVENGMTVTFDQPFVYNDGNLLVEFVLPTDGGSYSSCTFLGTSLTNASRYTYGSSYATASGTITGFLPKVLFDACSNMDPCPAVASVTATEVGVDEATLTWAASEGDYANIYDVWLSTEEVTDFETAPTAFAYSGTGTSYTLSNLDTYTQYYAYVRVRCNAQNSHQIDDGVSTWTGTAFHTNSVCAVPANAVATVTGKHTATLTWDNTSETQTDNFRVVLSTFELDNPSGVAAFYAQGIAATSLNLTDLASNTTYYCYVQNSCGDEGTSPWISCSFTTPEAMPAVINLATTNVSFNALTAVWESDVANFADETDWYVAIAPAGTIPADWTATTTRSAIFYGLTPTTDYVVYVSPANHDFTLIGQTTTVNVTTAAQPGNCLTVANGTATNSYVPIYGYYCDSPHRTQSIYPASMLTDLQGKTITSLKYYVYSGSSDDWSEAVFYVRMTTTDQANLASGFVIDPMTTVYSGTVTANTTDGMALTLNQPFTYTGGNLLIEFELVEEDDYSSCYFYGQSATSASRYSYEDNYGGMVSYTASFLPKVEFCCSSEPCRPVTHLAANSITNNSAVVSWYPGSSETEWVYVISTEELNETALAAETLITATTVTASLSGLDPDQNYYFYVRPVCDATVSVNAEWRSVHFVTLPLCSVPVSAVATASGNNQITFTVEDGEFGTSASYDYEIWVAGSEDAHTVYTAQTSPFVVNGLQSLTTYSWKVRTNCSAVEGSSRWTEGNDVYVCGDITITADHPFVEGFENTPNGSSTSHNFVSCWNRLNNGTTNFGYPYVSNSSSTAFEGSKYLYWYNTTTAETYGDYQVVVLPSVTNSIDALRLSFMAKTTSASYNSEFQIGVMTDPTDVSTFEELTTVNVSGTAYAEYDTYLGLYNYQGNGNNIAIKAVRPQSSWGVYIDNITLTMAPACIAPQHLAATSVTATDAAFTMDNAGDQGCEIAVTTTPTDHPENLTDDDVVASMTVVGNEFQLRGLTPNTHYYVYVKNVCSSNNADVSSDYSAIDFTTLCEAISVTSPYIEGFEDYTGTTYNANGVAPECWNVYSTGSILPHVIGSGSYYYPHTGTKALTFYGSGTQYAAMPRFDTPINQLMVEFWYRMESVTNGTLTLGYITENDVNYNTFTAISSINNTTIVSNHRENLSDVPATADRLVFKWYYSGQYSCCIDDIKVDSIRYSLTAVANNITYGTVTGSGTYAAGRTVEVTATPNFGYTFVGWDDQVTDAVRQVTVDGNINLTAIFEVDPCVIRQLPYTEDFDNITQSTTLYTGEYPACWTLAHEDVDFVQGKEPMIVYREGYAHSDNYCLFLNYRGIYAMPAVDFDVNMLKLSMYVRQPATRYRLQVGVMSDLNDATTFVPVQTVNLSGTDAPEYVEVDFSNYTGEGRYIAFRNTLGSGSYLYSYNYIDDITLDYGTRTVTVAVNDATMGTATGSGNYVINTEATLTATANEHYHFVGWSDQITTNPRVITVVEDLNVTAIFAIDEYDVTLTSSNNNQGTVAGAGSYAYNTEITISAMPNEHYRFLIWSDQNTDNPRTLTVTDNINLQAYFSPMQYNVTVVSSDETLGTVTGGGLFNYGAGVMLVATVTAPHYHFDQWSDGTTNNPRVFELEKDTTFIAYFELDQYQISADVNDIAMGTVTGTGYYDWNTSATIEAVPAPDHRFVSWSDQNTDNPRTINNITEDQHFTAIFEYSPSVICGLHYREFPYVENFDNITSSTELYTGEQPVCWTLAHEDVDFVAGKEPMVSYRNGYSHSGYYSLLLNYRGIYAMPAVDTNVNTLQMSLYVRQPATRYRMVVGVMSDLADESTFVPVATIANEGTTIPEYHEVDFSGYEGNGRYIAFRNILVGATGLYSYNYIDDVTLSVRGNEEPPIEEPCGLHYRDFPYTENFDDITTSTEQYTGAQPACWTLAHEDVAFVTGKEPMVCYRNGYSYSGYYSLLLNYLGIYAMPAVDTNVSALQMSLYVRQPATKYRMVVGVMSDLADASTFVPVATIANESTTIPEYHEVDFSGYEGNGRYIAFRNILDGATGSWSYNYIDDLTLSVGSQEEPPVVDPCVLHYREFPYVENFDNITTSTSQYTGAQPSCWTVAHEDVPFVDGKEPMISYRSGFAHSNNYSLLLNYRGIYAMPAVDTNVDALKMSLFVRQPAAKYRMEVGVMSDLADEGTFVSVATIANVDVSTPEYHEIDFSGYEGAGRYIAFRNILVGATGNYSYNYIDDVTISVIGEEPPVEEPCGLHYRDFPYTENFDNITNSTNQYTGVQPTCWTVAHEDVDFVAGKEPMVCYRNGYSYSGYYSLLLNYRGIYAMPAVDTSVNVLQMSMYVRQPATKYRMIVGVMSDLADASTFVPVATIANESTTMPEYHEVNFSGYEGNGRYIAFRNILDGATGLWSYNYVDDVTLTVRNGEEPPVEEPCGLHYRDFPYTENFDDITSSTNQYTGAQPTCWTVAHEDVAFVAGKEPMVCYRNGYSYSGYYSLLLNYLGIYAMPAVDTNVSALQMSLYVRQPATKYRMIVGVMSDLADASTFVPVATIANEGTAIPEFHEVDFSGYEGNGRYIAFRNILDGATGLYSYNYIDDVTISVREQEPPQENPCVLRNTDFPYTENFDNITTSTDQYTGVQPACWTVAHEDVAFVAGKEPMVSYRSGYAHSDNYSLLMNYRGIYAMPPVDVDVDVNTLQMSLYVRQPAAKYRLEVGVMSDLADESTFVAVATIANTDVATPEYHEVDFSGYTGNGRYIAFRNILVGATGLYSYNYIDDVTLSVNMDCGIHTLPYVENFDSYTTSTTASTGVEPTCWSLACADVVMTDAYKPMISYDAANATSGDYSLKLNKRGVYTMPAVDADVNTLQMTLNVKQDNFVYQLVVGVMSDPTDASTFVPVTTINNSTLNSEYHRISFAHYAGSGHYIAFRNINVGEGNGDYSVNYIDDITLSLIDCTIHALDLPYTENFESYTDFVSSTTGKSGVEPDCWTLAHQDVAMTDAQKPQIYYSTGTTNNHSGNYALQMHYRSIYAMPMVDVDVSTLTLNMYVRQTNAKYRLVVGVMSDLSDESTFVPVTTINNSTTTLTNVTVNFASYTGTGRYIAFRNISTGTEAYSYNYIDDITLSVATPAGAKDDNISEDVSGAASVAVYPNPTTGLLTVEGNDVQKVEVFDQVGRKVTVSEDSSHLDLTGYATGMYTLRITTPAGVEIRRVVKQ